MHHLQDNQSNMYFNQSWKEFSDKFGFQEQTGYLIPFNYKPHEFDFSQIERVLQNLSKMAEQDTLLEQMNKIDKIHVNQITSYRQLVVLRDCLSLILGQYLVNQRKKGKKDEMIILPKNFAEALYQSSNILGVKLGVTTTSCFNWKVNQKSQKIKNKIQSLKEIERNEITSQIKQIKHKSIQQVNQELQQLIPQDFSINDLDLKWFFTSKPEQERNFFGTAIVSSYHCVQIVKACYLINQQIQKDNQISKEQVILQKFAQIKKRWRLINQQLIMLPRNLDKDFFYNHIRLYVSSMQNVYFQGINKNLSSSGASAGQDPTFQMFQRLFGITYHGTYKEVQNKLKEGMWSKLISLQDYFFQNSKIKPYCTKFQNLTKQYNQIISLYVQFNKNHSYFIKKYILSFVPENQKQKAAGTGDNTISDLIKRWEIVNQQNITK